jgi:hypothetical protein
MKRKNLLPIIAGIVLVLAIGGAIFALTQLDGNDNKSKDDAKAKMAKNAANVKDYKTTGVVVISGNFGCISPKGSDAAKTTECALGMTTSDKKIYLLQSDDPTLVGSVPTGQLIQVSGNQSAGPNDKYGSTATIHVTQLTKL